MSASLFRRLAFWAYVLLMLWLVVGLIRLRNESMQMAIDRDERDFRRCRCEWSDLSKWDKLTGYYICVETGKLPCGRSGVGMQVWGGAATFDGGGGGVMAWTTPKDWREAKRCRCANFA